MVKNGELHIRRKVLHNGIEISLGRKDYFLTYPQSIWRQFPDVYRQNFADSVTYFLTMHLSLTNHKKLIYNFPPPPTESFFFKGMVYSLPETSLTESNVTMGTLLKKLYNTHFKIEFGKRPRYARFKNVNRNSTKRSIIPFSFGKDSLLTFALSKELSIEPYPIFFREPRSPYENRHKYRLAQRFFDEFDIDVNIFPVTPGWLRQTTGKWWGWDLLLTQYTLLLIPYIFGTRSKYLFWANEASCNEVFTDEDGYRVNPVFEQSCEWLLSSNAIAKVMGSNSIFASLVEPIHELAIMKILHYRYPQIAKYQMSCFADEDQAKTKRWCGVCTKCARIYIFMLALGINPRRVGFTENMLLNKKKKLYTIFSNGDGVKDSAYAESGIGRDEQLLAFLMAYQKGVKGPLMDLFIKKFLKIAKHKEKKLRKIYFGIHTTKTLTYDLTKPLMKIYEEELESLRNPSRP